MDEAPAQQRRARPQSALTLAIQLGLAAIFTLAVATTGFARADVPAASASPAPKTIESVIGIVLARNPGMRTYRALAHLDLRQTNFPYLHPILDGLEYYSSPGFIVFNFPHTPFYLKGITKFQGSFANADRWQTCYNIVMTGKPNGYLLHMVPKIQGEISAIDVLLDQAGAIDEVDWYYRNNIRDHIHVVQTYSTIDSYNVVTQQTSDVLLHHIRVKGTQTFSGFSFNVPVPTPTPTPSDPGHRCDN